MASSCLAGAMGCWFASTIPAEKFKPVMGLDAARKELIQTIPSFLPDGNRFLYASVSPENSGFYIASLDGKTPPTRVIPSTLMRTTGLAYAEPGFILTAVEGKLTAQRFNSSSLKVEDDPVTLTISWVNSRSPTLDY